MKQFKIYSNPQGTLEAVKVGWSWPGFIFQNFWALFKKMWLLGGALTFAYLLVEILSPSSYIFGMSGFDIFVITLSLILSIVFGIKGNEWREGNLKSRGYEYKGSLKAQNSEGAIAAYFKDPASTDFPF
jgi:hypothetical protein